jgi:hypothetical protein
VSIKGDFVKLAAMRQHVERLSKMGPAVAHRAAPELTSQAVSFAPSGSGIVGSFSRKFPSSWRSTLPGKWRDDIEDAAKAEFEAITGGA